jgi:arylsulfatase A-like enzyme
MTITSTAAELPNIVIVYTDDLGFGDLSIYNPKAAYKTPSIDRMAREGIMFTDAHSPSTICSPSRYGLFSGQQIYRSTGRGGGAFEGPGGPSYLKPGTLTLGDMLRSKGYRTGVFGKWHVGLTWYDDNGKRLGGGFANSRKINYEKSTPLIDGPNSLTAPIKEDSMSHSSLPTAPAPIPSTSILKTAWFPSRPPFSIDAATCLTSTDGFGTMTRDSCQSVTIS